MSLDLYLPFMESLKSYNECVNIYSKSAYDRLGFHIQDSLILAALIAHGNERVVDFGSGAGFPSFFIAHQNPSIITVSVESKEKKRIFLRQLKEEYALSNWHIFDGDIKQFLDHNRKPIDCLTAKAFGSVSKIMSYFQSRHRKPSSMLLPISKNQSENISLDGLGFKKYDIIRKFYDGISYYYASYF